MSADGTATSANSLMTSGKPLDYFEWCEGYEILRSSVGERKILMACTRDPLLHTFTAARPVRDESDYLSVLTWARENGHAIFFFVLDEDEDPDSVLPSIDMSSRC